MPRYRRYFKMGNFYFLTLVANNRNRVFSEYDVVQRLYDSFNHCKNKYPFRNHAYIILPDHLYILLEFIKSDTPADLVHCVKRTSLLKLKQSGYENILRFGTIWQRRYYDHVIRDEEDFVRHLDYIHFNPVKHGYIDDAHKWKFSSIGKYKYPPDWGNKIPDSILDLNYD